MYRIAPAPDEQEKSVVELSDFLVRYPFDYLAEFECETFQSHVAISSNEPWWSPMQHKIVIMFALIVQAWKRRFSNLEECRSLARYVGHARDELVAHCNKAIKPQNPIIAELVRSKIVGSLLDLHKSMCSCTPPKIVS